MQGVEQEEKEQCTVNGANGFDPSRVVEKIFERNGNEYECQQRYAFQEGNEAQAADGGGDVFFHNQNIRIYGRWESGEKGHGMAIRMISRVSENQISMVVNWALYDDCRLARADPMVSRMVAMSIRVI